MMDSFLNNKAEGREQVEVDDLKRDLSSEFTTVPDSQHSCIEEREHLQVYLRIRPFTSAESNNGESQDCVTIESPDTVLLKPPSLSLSARLSTDRSLPQTGQRFQFSQVYGPETTQRELFEGTVKDLVKDVLEGRNSLVFTYGVTNAGKTFTFLGPDADAGILPRSLDVIFSSIDEQVFPEMSVKPHRCREFTRLTREQQNEEALFKRNLFRQLKESEKSNISLSNSTNKTLLEGSSMLGTTVTVEDKISLEVETNTKFSIWVSFCEIYNENIHDLLEVVSSGAPRRTALRLSQDVKGNAFVKDLRWVQINSAEEAYRVMKLGKKNQSFSSTRLNHLSSRSHSIFSIRILRIEDIGTLRVQTVSELCLCDLAGSERCAKTQNKGDRLKEAGNINTSLLTLGKCINALRHNQQAKLLQHVPFRESKLTHYLQGFFCGRGKACMIVNINQCASMYDETLNVLKFSAVAQKVVVLSSRPLPIMPQRSASEVSFIINNAERRTLRGSRRSSLIGWESSLEDVQEDEDDESLMDDTMDQTGNEEDGDENDDKIVICKKMHQRQAALLKQLQIQLKKERAESLLMEAQVREEISREFSELFSEMQSDYDDRLAREREILEEQAERRLEIFKNLIDKMAKAGPSQDTQAMDTFLDSYSFELAGMKNSAEAAHMCRGSGRAGAQADKNDTIEELEVDEQQPHKQNGEANGVEDEEKTRLLSQLEEKSSQIVWLEKQVKDLQTTAELGSHGRSLLVEERSSCQKEQLQEALTALEKEKKAREDALAALQYQTIGKEEALASLEEERKAREEAIVALKELKQSKEELQASLEEERNGKEGATAALEAEKRAKEDAVAALAQEKRSREDAIAALGEEMSGKEEVRSALEAERKEISRLVVEKEERQQENDALQQEVREMNDKLKASERQVTIETEKAAQASVQLQTVQAQLDDHSKEIQEKSSQIHTLTEEVQRLKQELQTSTESSDGINNQLREEASELRKALTEEKEKNDSKQSQILELDSQLSHIKQQLAEKQLISDQQLEEFTEKLNQKEAASNRQVEELRKKLQQQEETSRQPLEELRSHLESQQQAAKEEIEQLKAKLEQQTEASEKQVEQLNEKLREQEVLSLQQLEEIKQKLGEDKTASDKLLDDVKQKLTEQEKTAELLKAELEEAKFKCPTSNSEAEEDHKRLNSDLQTEVASLKVKISNMEETKESSSKAEAQIPSSEIEQMLKEKDTQMEEKLAELEKASAQKEAELQDQLLEKEAEVTSLKKSLQEAQERREEEECQAVQEARRREVERRRELLAVAHEAIAQKDAELEKKAEEISRLKEEARQDLEKVKSLGLDLQRKEDDSSDLREKLADYKKQIQQVQKEISTMREEEKSLKQKLADSEKAKKHLQSDLTNRDRTIQQLKVEQSSNTKSDETHQLYQKACKDLEAKQRVMEDMRLALMEQEETQEQMEQVLEEKLNLIQELSDEVERLKAVLLKQDCGSETDRLVDHPSDDVKLAKEEAARAQESLKLCTDKHQAERRKWLEEKLSLIGQAKEAEDKRNQEMRKFAEDRERYTRQHNQLESQLTEKDQTMEKWRKERDTLVAALEIQLQKLLSSQAEKDKLIKELQQNIPQPPLESSDGGDAGSSLAELKAALSEREAEILRLKKDLQASTAKQEDTVTPVRSKKTENNESPATLVGKPESETINRKSGRRDTRASVSSQSSTGCPSVLDSSEISTENGRTSRFPRPELEISFSPLQPNRVALRRQGEESAVTVKITRSARKRKSSEMEKSHIFRRSKRRTLKEEVEAENRRNTRTKLTPKLTPHKEESSAPAARHDSQSSIRSRKEGTLQKIGDFLQSSPTLLGSKAKKMMSLVSGRVDADSAASTSSLGLRAKKNKRKLYRPEISSPMDMPSHPIISREPEEEESDHQVIKRRLRSRMAK
ncbi:kinesin-like protein KIF20B isoform X2 [Amphiprion ocellaris]|uniref:kinesin-like protein KIF20B isoform X2 n=1 Tax=Amphiprion ocellaris TaxID=80972 RepID=UPI002411839E|nr:kinesin-like protein KIF20B isoform X2 [Amphiprion ocellaris]